MNNKVNHTNTLVRLALVSALYVILTICIAPISYGMVQVRISEVLVLLVFYDKRYIYSLTIGCLIANMMSPLGIVDIIVGTLGTLFSCIAISKSKTLLLASLWPTFFCIPVVFLLHLIIGVPFWIYLLGFSIGEFLSVTVIGCTLIRILENKSIFKKLILLN